jgi:hypothetical protein
VVAASLLKQREVVISRLAHLGARIVEGAADQLPLAVVNNYLDAKRKDLL